MKQLIKEFKAGSIYAICTRPGVGKTHFCLSIAALFSTRGKKVLYISNTMDKDNFYERQKAICSDCSDNISFNEVYKLTIKKLDMIARENDYDLIVLDPFDIYALDLDVGELKDYAKKNDIVILLSKNLSKSLLLNRREYPSLRDIKFTLRSIRDKFLAYVDIIVLAYRKTPHSPISLTLAKNIYGSIGTTIELNK